MSIFTHLFPASGCTQAVSCPCALLDRAHKCVCRMSWPCSTCHQRSPVASPHVARGVVSKLHFVSDTGTLPFYKQLYKIFIFSKKISEIILSKKNLPFIFENESCNQKICCLVCFGLLHTTACQIQPLSLYNDVEK